MVRISFLEWWEGISEEVAGAEWRVGSAKIYPSIHLHLHLNFTSQAPSRQCSCSLVGVCSSYSLGSTRPPRTDD
jgi:hypothetical protein